MKKFDKFNSERKKYWKNIEDLLISISEDEQIDFFDENYCGFVNIDPSISENIYWKIIVILLQKNNKQLQKLLKKYNLKITSASIDELIFETTLTEKDIKKLYPYKYENYMRNKAAKNFYIIF